MDGNGQVFDYHDANYAVPAFQPLPLFEGLQLPYRYEPEAAPQFPGPQILVPPAIFSYWYQLDKMLSEPTEDELAEFQKLSNEYIPAFTGPLIGQRTSTSVIAQQFANADAHQLQAQSLELSKEYDSWRVSRGDGNCGWRAMAFGYMELLIRLGDRQKFFEEIARLQSLNNLLNDMGYEETVYEDFVNATIELLRDLANAADPDSLLLERFNDGETCNAIIVHLRMITSVWMRKYAEAYQPYLIGQTVEEYCSTHVDPFQEEIEQYGINALLDVLIKPTGFALEIVNLDRSAGEQANVHRFEPTDSTGNPLYDNPPTIRLLLRPGHYDIIYKAEDVQPLAPTQLVAATVELRLANRFPTVDNWSRHGQARVIPDVPFRAEPVPNNFDMLDIVSESDVPCGTASLLPFNTFYSDLVGSYAPPMPVSSLVHGMPRAATQLTSGYQDPLSSMMGAQISWAFQNPVSSAMSLTPAPTKSEDQLGPTRTRTSNMGRFRPSTLQFEASLVCQDLPLTTAPMIESPLSTHHYRNDNFQPFQETPNEEKDPGSKSRGSGHRSSRR